MAMTEVGFTSGGLYFVHAVMNVHSDDVVCKHGMCVDAHQG